MAKKKKKRRRAAQKKKAATAPQAGIAESPPAQEKEVPPKQISTKQSKKDSKKKILAVAIPFVLVAAAALIFFLSRSGKSEVEIQRDSELNVLLVTLDTTRADRIGIYGHVLAKTPNLDDLASGCALFTQATSVGPGTQPSFIALFTSTYPLMYGGQLYITSWRTTLAQVLKEHGYHTAAFHSNPTLSSYFGYHTGFDTFDDSYQKRHYQGLLSKPKELAKRIIGSGRLYEFLLPIYLTLS